MDIFLKQTKSVYVKNQESGGGGDKLQSSPRCTLNYLAKKSFNVDNPLKNSFQLSSYMGISNIDHPR